MFIVVFYFIYFVISQYSYKLKNYYKVINIIAQISLFWLLIKCWCVCWCSGNGEDMCFKITTYNIIVIVFAVINQERSNSVCSEMHIPFNNTVFN